MRFHRNFIVVIMLCTACAVHAKTLDTLVIEGASIQQPQVIRDASGFVPGMDITPAALQAAIKNVYRLGQFRTVDFYVTSETDSVAALLCKVTEYPLLESIKVTGNKKIKRKAIDEVFDLKKGQVVTDAQMFEDAVALRKKYEEKGYLLAEVKDTLVPTDNPGNVRAEIIINEHEKVAIRTITFSGNENVSAKKLRSKFKTKAKGFLRSGEYNEESYKNNLDSLILYYNDLGYVDAHIAHDSVWYSDNKKDLNIAIEVSEGKKYYTGNFSFIGNTVLDSRHLEQMLALSRGKPFQKKNFDKTLEQLGNAYREQGYLWAQVRDQLSYRDDTIDIIFNIVENSAAIIHRIDIAGNEKTDENVIRRELSLYPGQKYRQSLMMRSVRDINQLNFFSNVKPDLLPGDDGTIDLNFDVTEKENIGQFSLGAAYSQTENFMGTLNLSIPNFRGKGEKLDLGFQIGESRQNVSLNFTEPWAFNSPTTLSGGISYDNIKYTNGDHTVEYGFDGSIGRRLTWPDDYFSAGVNYELKWKDDYDTNSSPYSNGVHLHPKGLCSKVGFRLRRDDTDMPTFPSEGSIFMLEPEIAGLGGDYRYIKTIFSYDSYFPLFWKFVLGAHGKVGAVNSLPGMSDILISRWDLLSAGGVWYTDGIIRGYDDASLGGRYTPKNGKALLTLSSEIRFPVVDQMMYLSMFGDVGNTWAGLEDVNLTDLYPGIGAGVRLLVPMLGLLGFDFGYGLRSPTQSEHFGEKVNGWKFHFQMGKGY
jgi:outer membrane protein insertion porin family